jgi:hypothetical protein
VQENAVPDSWGSRIRFALSLMAVAVLSGGTVWFLAAPGDGARPKMVLKEAAQDRAAPAKPEMAGPAQIRPMNHNNPDLDVEDQRLRAISVDNYKPLEWKTLRGLNVKTGEITPQVKAIEGATIKIPGYMVPFDDDEERVTQFLLVPQAGMCIHTPPPPPNQLILVEMTGGEAKLVDWARQITVFGQIEIAPSSSPYGPVSYKVNAKVARAD